MNVLVISTMQLFSKFNIMYLKRFFFCESTALPDNYIHFFYTRNENEQHNAHGNKVLRNKNK